MADDDLTARLRWPADAGDSDRRERARPASPSPLRSVPPPGTGSTDTDLALVREELADLRHAVDDLADRVELRQLRASLEEVRREVLALRRAVVERPDLEQLTEDVAALRSELVTAGPPATASDPAVLAALDELRTGLGELAATDEPVVALTPVLDEVRELRREVVALRRRVALRTQADESVSDERLAELLEAVLEQRTAGRGRARRPR